MAAPALSIQTPKAARLADPRLRDGLLSYARRRLPPGEVEDLVQNTLTEALLASNAPSDESAFRRWVHGIARHKIADSYRRRARLPIPTPDADQSAAEASPSAGELSQWIESELPKTEEAQATLHWLLRESDGESLDEIARDLDLPAPRVRQRVSRLRRHFHARWLALGLAGLLLSIGAGLLFTEVIRSATVPPSIAREPATPLERARGLRENALLRCAAGAYAECVAELDQAKALDPSGESASAIRIAREAAANLQLKAAIPPSPVVSSSGPARDGKTAPKRLAPRRVGPKEPAPSKALPKLDPAVAEPNQNAIPSKKAWPADETFVEPGAKPGTKPNRKN